MESASRIGFLSLSLTNQPSTVLGHPKATRKRARKRDLCASCARCKSVAIGTGKIIGRASRGFEHACGEHEQGRINFQAKIGGFTAADRPLLSAVYELGRVSDDRQAGSDGRSRGGFDCPSPQPHEAWDAYGRSLREASD